MPFNPIRPIAALLAISSILTLFVFFYPKKTDPLHFTLSNGLEVVVVPNHKAPVVTQMLWYKVGSIDEKKSKTGLAHFLEHLMFRGTHSYKEGVFSRMVTERGGSSNAFTSFDSTVYYQTIAKEHLPIIMRLEADRMHGLAISPEIVEKERNVILEERLLRVDNVPVSVLTEKMRNVLFAEHPYSQPIIGWEEDIRNLSFEDIMEFYRKYYTPNNALLVLAGDITPEYARELAQDIYRPIEVTNAPERNPPEWKGQNKEIKIITHSDPRVETAEWLTYYSTPGYLHTENKKRTYALELAAYLLAGHDNAAMYEALVVNENIARYVSSGYDPLALGPSVFQIYALPADGISPETLGKYITDYLHYFAENGIDEASLERAKIALVADEIFAQDSVFNLASAHGEVVSLGLEKSYIEEWKNHIKAVTREDIKEAIISLQETPSVTGILLPQKKE